MFVKRTLAACVVVPLCFGFFTGIGDLLFPKKYSAEVVVAHKEGRGGLF